MKALAPERLPRLHEVGVEARVVGFTAAVTLLAGAFFGCLPDAQQTWRNTLQLVVRTSIDPRAAVAAVRHELRALDADLPLAEVATLADVADRSYDEPRFLAWLTGTFAAVALVLAAVGLYGVMSYTVSRRRREIALRMALGAAAGRVLRLVIARGMRLVVAGALAGVAGALALSRFLEGLLYGVEPTDPWTIAAVVVLLAAVALLANFLPARRAARTDPAAVCATSERTSKVLATPDWRQLTRSSFEENGHGRFPT